MGVGFIITNCIYHLFFFIHTFLNDLALPLNFIFVTSGLSPSLLLLGGGAAYFFFFGQQLSFKDILTHLNFICLI